MMQSHQTCPIISQNSYTSILYSSAWTTISKSYAIYSTIGCYCYSVKFTHGEVENISDEFTFATPDRFEKIMSRLRLSQTTARQEMQLNFKPSIQQCATGTNRFLQGGAASTISLYGTLPPKHDLSAFKTPEREVHAYQITHLRPGVVAVKEPELIVQRNPPQIPAVVSTSPRRCIATTHTSAGSCPITAEKDTPNSTSPNAKVLALFFPKEVSTAIIMTKVLPPPSMSIQNPFLT